MPADEWEQWKAHWRYMKELDPEGHWAPIGPRPITAGEIEDHQFEIGRLIDRM